MTDWGLIRAGCPRCGTQQGGPRGLHHNAASVWCLGCGWAQNWRPESLHWNPELAEGYRRMNEAFAAAYVEAHRQLAAEFAAMLRHAREERGRR